MRTGMVNLYVLRNPYALGVTSAKSAIRAALGPESNHSL
jgi:hypothetical protein